MSGLHEGALLALSDDKGSETIYASSAHLAVAMRLAFHGKSSLFELHSYLTKEGVNASLEQVTAVLDEFKSKGYVLAKRTDASGRACYDASDSLVKLVKRRAPSRAQFESRGKPSFI